MLMIAQATRVATQPAAPPAVPWLEQQFLNNTVAQWALLVGILLATFVIGKAVGFFLRRHGQWLIGRKRLEGLGMVLAALSGPLAMLIFAVGLRAGGQFMTLDAPGETKVADFWNAVCQTIAALAVGWAVYRLVDVLEAFLKRWTSKTQTQLDDELVPIIRKTLRVVVVIIVGLFIVQNIFGQEIGPMLAGLGLGGLAFALAAQDSLKNLFGSVTIFADRPFQIGERVKIGEHDGVVEEVGFRSTRVRTLTGHLVTIPNSKVADLPVENIGRRPYIKRVLDVTVTYDTPPEKVRRGVEILREMLDARRDHFPPDLPGRVYFSDFNAASLNILVYYWFTPPDWWEYLTFTHEFNMELLRRFNDEGIEFAFPTQTLYVKQDSPAAAD